MVDLQQIIEQCAQSYPQINFAREELKGIPHLRGTQLTVSMVLDRLYVHGSISAAIQYYSDITKNQMKEAIAYAATFIHLVCQPSLGA